MVSCQTHTDIANPGEGKGEEEWGGERDKEEGREREEQGI